jgi:hypothetical protein
MANQVKIHRFKSMNRLVDRIRGDLENVNFILLYAYNATGKTRLSVEFKNRSKRKNSYPDTLYFNAFTEDLFYWDNDLDSNVKHVLKMNSASRFFAGLKALDLESKINRYLYRYASFDFRIDYDQWQIVFFKGAEDHIKISRGEEHLFIWCIFMAICELVTLEDPYYTWVKYIYIDDPISSLDDDNVISVATDLCKLLKKSASRLKIVISSHHSLFFNVVCNELKKVEHKKYFLHRDRDTDEYSLQSTNDTPFFHHVAMLSQLQQAVDSGKLYTYHFNILRSILEKTATFFGFSDFSDCVTGIEDEILYARALNLLSHGNYSVFQPQEMGEDTKILFKRILKEFLKKYSFDIPSI